ncbi:MAG: tRNA pseudouridine(38-40) synthase TruA [Nitrospinae bacterium]|nr:tRNA pseudouridine(38-40) synthase TruA [Nitrospinota bacterium]
MSDEGLLKRRIRMDLQYLGTNYAGWQWQDNALSIQEVVENALEKIVGHHARLHASGRTDAGVHAEFQPAHADVATRLPDYKILNGLNSLLPADVAVLAVSTTPETWHSRFSAIEKTYRYTIFNRRIRSPFLIGRAWLIHRRLDVEAMRAGSLALLGEHDFSSFRSAGCSAKHPVRAITEAFIERAGDVVTLRFTSNGFLRQMVRNMVGTLVDVGKGKMEPGAVNTILEARNRALAGPCAPAEGLSLIDVRY